MWFAALEAGEYGSLARETWLLPLLDPGVLALLASAPALAGPLTYVRVDLHRYRFAAADEPGWWVREYVGPPGRPRRPRAPRDRRRPVIQSSWMLMRSSLTSLALLPYALIVGCQAKPPMEAMSSTTESESSTLVPTSTTDHLTDGVVTVTETTGPGGLCEIVCPELTALEGGYVTPDNTYSYMCVGEITGDLTLAGIGWERDQFFTLQRVRGTLEFNTSTCDFSFLPCLRSVGSLILNNIESCETDTPGLEDLAEIDFQLRITDSNILSLPNLAGLQTGPSTVFMFNNPMFQSFGAFKAPAKMTAVVLDTMPKLADLSLLDQVEEIGFLSLGGLPNVTTLAELGGLTVANDLRLGTCSDSTPSGLGIVDLSGLENLAQVGELTLSGNPHLSELGDTPMLSVTERVVFRANPMLSQAEIDDFLLQNVEASAEVCAGEEPQCACP